MGLAAGVKVLLGIIHLVSNFDDDQAKSLPHNSGGRGVPPIATQTSKELSKRAGR